MLSNLDTDACSASGLPPAMGFPITLAALLISIEPLIDMARTALNVNGAMTAGVLTECVLREPST